ncbi:glutathione S-transferase N-terminal domain-containing protein [Pelagibius sp.]|uniref:glutathione S-transferase N-terminal domain-containing protein n=1 Tax=Pelagibius sp. TaxID=1931238 RepID=UPI003BB04D1A
MGLILYERLCGDDRRPSPYCWRARLALAHKGLKPEYRPVKFTERDRVAFSGQAKVPVLADSDRVVSDSWDIACYLEDTYPDAPSLFDGAGGRALARFISHWTDNSLQKALSPILAPYMLAAVHPDDRDYYRQTREARYGESLQHLAARRALYLEALHPVLEPLRQHLAESSFICGERPAYADYLAFAEFQWARSVCDQDILAPEDSTLRAWRHCMLDLFDGLARSVPAFDSAA